MKKYLALLLALVMVFALCACGSKNETPAPAGSDDAAAPAAGGELTFATGGESGTYYAFGTVLAQHVSDKTDTKVTAIVGNGSQANVEDLWPSASPTSLLMPTTAPTSLRNPAL